MNSTLREHFRTAIARKLSLIGLCKSYKNDGLHLDQSTSAAERCINGSSATTA